MDPGPVAPLGKAKAGDGRTWNIMLNMFGRGRPRPLARTDIGAVAEKSEASAARPRMLVCFQPRHGLNIHVLKRHWLMRRPAVLKASAWGRK
eukprot:7698298-Alexandrium_andersonii.AAC.1